MRFFTADTHFGHAGILRHCKEQRPFETIDAMNSALIDAWNSAVRDGDTVYCLGDFAFKRTQMQEVLPFLKGEKHLIVGNHDPYFKHLVNDSVTGRRKDLLVKQQEEDAKRIGFASIALDVVLDLDGKKVRLNHFPYANPEGEPEYENRCIRFWPKPAGEDMLLHGHIHQKWRCQQYVGHPFALNVGVDVNALAPVSETEVLAELRKRTAK